MKIYTIGHSTRPFDEFIDILVENHIHCLVDVRSYPGSNKYPQYNKAVLRDNLADYGIKYYHIADLGGRRHNKISYDTDIEVKAFSSYAEYMLTDEFKEGLTELKKIARKCKTVYMCSEAVWWRCHRRMISDQLEFEGWKVFHLGLEKKPVRHTIWNLARFDKKTKKVYYDKIFYEIKRIQ